jgi:hypothetical protein
MLYRICQGVIVEGNVSIKSDYEIGEDVLIYKINLSNKLTNEWKTGLQIIGKIPPDAYRVKNGTIELRLNKKDIKRNLSTGGKGVSCCSNASTCEIICSNVS